MVKEKDLASYEEDFYKNTKRGMKKEEGRRLKENKV